MIYVKKCPECGNKVSFLDNEDSKKCRECGEDVINDYKETEKKPKKTKAK
jgi:DNA-directed RNA polymerase subunit RPC12/RpoP